jgi:hypothetical protein
MAVRGCSRPPPQGHRRAVLRNTGLHGGTCTEALDVRSTCCRDGGMAGADAIEIGGFGDLGFFPRRSRSTGSRQTDPPRLQHATGEGPTRRGTGGEGVNGEGEEGGDGWVGLPSGTTAGVILQTREKLAPFGDTTRRGRTREELGDVAEIVPRPDEVWRRRPHRRCHGPLGLGFRAAGWGPSLHAYGSWLRLGWRRARRHRGNPPPRWSVLGACVWFVRKRGMGWDHPLCGSVW